MLDQLAASAIRSWHRPQTAVLLAVGVPLLVLYLVTDNGSHAPTLWGWGFVIAVFLGIAVPWRVMNRVAPVPKGKTGVVVAITCEDDKHDQQVRADFVKKLQELLTRDPQSGNFHLIVLPPHHAQRVVALADASNEPAKLRAHFMLYGTVRRRQIRGKQTHVIAFEGVVRHVPVPVEVQKAIQVDFTNVLPRRVNIEPDGDVFAFEATAEWADVSARYIIGLAALISGSVGYAERLLLDVERRLVVGRPGMDPLRQISSRLPARLIVLYEVWLRHLINRYTQTREDEYVHKADEIAGKLLARAPKHRAASLMKAIAEFIIRRDVAAARQLIYKAKMSGDVTAMYSLAFLDAYEGNLSSAEAWYRKAFAGPLDDVTVPIQCEEFIAGVLATEPQKAQLHYCSGLINFYAKKDHAGARRDLTAFLAAPESLNYPQERATTEKLIGDCQQPEDDAAA